MRLAACAAALLLTGCTCEPVGVETRRFACASDLDCVAGFACQGGFCQRADTADAGPGDGGQADAGQADAGQADAGALDAGPALRFLVTPSTLAVPGFALAVQPVVALLDAQGQPTPSSVPVALSRADDATCAAPSMAGFSLADNPVAADAGVAVFDGVAFTGGTTAWLSASAPGFAPVCSAAIALSGDLFADRANPRRVRDQGNANYGWVVFADLDEDGRPDLVIDTARDAGTAFFRNQAPQPFADAQRLTPSDRAIVAADCDGDGWRDLVFTSSTGASTCRVLRNARDGGFVDVTPPSGLGDTNPEGAAMADLDGDGFNDLALPDGTTGGLHVFHNDGACGFTDATAQAQLPDAGLGNGELVLASDTDGDGDVDLLYTVAQDLDGGGALLHFRNDGDGTFTEDSAALGLGAAAALDYRSSLALGDVDNDGRVDLFIGRAGRAPSLLRNQPDGGFTPFPPSEVTASTGEFEGAAFGDFDHDGWLDLFVAMNGAGDRVYRNLGGGRFVSTGLATGLTHAEPDKDSSGVAVADVDGDGDLDVYVNHRGTSFTRLYENQLDAQGFLKVRVRGRGTAGHSPVDGTGATVFLFDASGTRLLASREVTTGGGAGQSDALVHFGLSRAWGGDDGSYVVKVRFASGLFTRGELVVPRAAMVTLGPSTLAHTVEVVEPP